MAAAPSHRASFAVSVLCYFVFCEISAAGASAQFCRYRLLSGRRTTGPIRPALTQTGAVVESRQQCDQVRLRTGRFDEERAKKSVNRRDAARAAFMAISLPVVYAQRMRSRPLNAKLKRFLFVTQVLKPLALGKSTSMQQLNWKEI